MRTHQYETSLKSVLYFRDEIFEQTQQPHYASTRGVTKSSGCPSTAVIPEPQHYVDVIPKPREDPASLYGINLDVVVTYYND